MEEAWHSILQTEEDKPETITSVCSEEQQPTVIITYDQTSSRKYVNARHTDVFLSCHLNNSNLAGNQSAIRPIRPANNQNKQQEGERWSDGAPVGPA